MFTQSEKTEMFLTIIIGFIVFIITLSISYFSYNHHIQKLNQHAIKYQTATELNQDKIDYALKTNMGRIGVNNVDISAVQPVTSDFLKDKYTYIEYVHEEYTMHIEVITTTDDKGNTHTETRTYWTWDDVDSDKQISQNLSFNGTIVPTKSVDLNPERLELSDDIVNLQTKTSSFLGIAFDISDKIQNDYIYKTNDSRYRFYYVPSNFTKKSIFAQTGDTLIPINKKIELYDKSVKEVKDGKQKKTQNAIKNQTPVSCVIAITITILTEIGLYYIKNK